MNMENIATLLFALFIIFKGIKAARKLNKECKQYRDGKFSTHFKKNFVHQS